MVIEEKKKSNGKEINERKEQQEKSRRKIKRVTEEESRRIRDQQEQRSVKLLDYKLKSLQAIDWQGPFPSRIPIVVSVALKVLSM